jgi:hypothetical protein
MRELRDEPYFRQVGIVFGAANAATMEYLRAIRTP